MANSNIKTISKLREEIAELRKTISDLEEKLAIAKAPVVLPSGFFFEHDNNDDYVLHIPAQRTFHPIVLPKDPIAAFGVIRRIFMSRKVLPANLGRASCPTQSMVDDWVKEGGKITTDRKVNPGEIEF
jgi:hypothetical protein